MVKEAGVPIYDTDDDDDLLDYYDRCDECRGLGDDYYFDENGDLASACEDCPFNT